MESFNKLVVVILVLGASFCFNLYAQTAESESNEGSWIVFGDTIDASGFVEEREALKTFEALGTGERTEMSIKAKVKSVCQMKGCWMVIDMEGKEELRVTFKDYGFFVPLDLAGKEVIISGTATSGQIGVEELRHYAKDAGMSKEEIENITEARKTYSLIADGVIIKE